jgi:hypothetical protein
MKAYARTSLVLATLALGGTFAVGCAPEPPKKAKIVEVDGPSSGSSSKSSANDEASGTSDDDLNPPQDPTSAETPDGTSTQDPSQQQQDPQQSPPGSTGSAPPPNCTATAEGNTSYSELAISTAGGEVTITSLTVKVTNRKNRNKNDVDLYATQPGGQEQHILNSGDILTNNQTVSVPLPNDFKVKTGTRMRIVTNFDDTFGDPHGPCDIQL